MSSEAAAALTATAAGSRTEETDLELVRRAQKGDADAFSVLVLRHQHLVFNLAYRFMRDETHAEDMAQEAFIKGFRLIKGFRGDCSFSTWMYRVTASVCLTELSRQKRRREVEMLPFHERCRASAPLDGFDMSAIIRRCVAKLPKRYANVITLYYLRETPYEEIAESLGIPLGTLKTWMHRARKQLRKIVEKELGSHELPNAP